MMRLLAVLSAVFLGIGVTVAQEGPPLRGRAGERLEQWKKLRLMEKLEMNEETSIRFFARYNKHMEELRGIGGERFAIISELEPLTKEKGSDAKIERLLGDLGKVEVKIAEARSRFLDELKTILTMRQIGAYVIFERDFNQNIRQIMQEVAKERLDRRQLR